jgi:GNAT superfamily N-acetyltransferase
VPDETTVRRATLDDLDEVLALWTHYLRQHRGNPAYRLAKPGLEKRRELFRQHIEGPKSVVFVLARRDGGLDGMVTCFAEENLPYFVPPRYARIQTPYVREDARRRGNLRQLITAALRWAREEEFVEIRMYTPATSVVGNAIAEELGFEAIEVVRRKPVDWRSPPERQLDDRGG